MVSFRPHQVATLSLALLLGMCITGASQRWCCISCDCWELSRLLKMLFLTVLSGMTVPCKLLWTVRSDVMDRHDTVYELRS